MTKLKHVSGVYKVLPDTPKPEDIKYWLISSKKKSFKMEDIIKSFGASKQKIIEDSLSKLVDTGELTFDETSSQYLKKF